jgi:hypothetical protein
VAGGVFIPLAGGVVPGAQPPVVEGAQFMVPSGAGVTAGVDVFAGVVVSVRGAGVGVVGVTTPGVVAVPGADVPVPVPCAAAAMAEIIVQATAKHAMAKNAPPCR